MATRFLNNVARKLGHAAGTVTNVAKEFTSALPRFSDPAPLTATSRQTSPAKKTAVPPEAKAKRKKPARLRQAAGKGLTQSTEKAGSATVNPATKKQKLRETRSGKVSKTLAGVALKTSKTKASLRQTTRNTRRPSC